MKSYIHIGIGAPYHRSHEIFFSELRTSTALKKEWDAVHMRYPAFLFTSIPQIVDKFKAYAVRRYKSWDRIYYVFPCYTRMCELITRAVEINEWIIKYRKYRLSRKIEDMFNEALMANTINEMLDKLQRIADEIKIIQTKINEQINARREALFNRFRRNHERNKHILERYFPELLPLEMFKHIHFYNLPYYEYISEQLQKLGFEGEIAEQYTRFFYSRNMGIVISRITNTIEILMELSVSEELRIYADSCEENEKFAVCKLIATRNDEKVLFIAVIGYDKLTKQRFIHYVPPTLILRNVETCRKWVLGLVDNYGKPIYENVELIET
jgi:hypothetical protein